MQPDRPEPAPPVRHLLARLAAVMQVPVLAACVALFVIQWDNQMDHAREEMRTTTSAIAAKLRERFAAIERRMDKLAAEVPPGDDPQALAEFHAKASRVARELEVEVIVLVRPDGQQVVNTRVPFGSPLPHSPEGMLKAVRTGRPAVSDLAVAPVAKVHAAGLSVPVIRDGHIAYGLNAGLEHTNFRRLLDTVALPEGWSACIADTRRTVVAHRGGGRERPVGQAYPHVQPGTDTAGDHGPFDVEEGGSPAQVFSRVSASTGWSSHVTVPHSVLYAPLRHAAAELALALAVVFLLSMWGATRVARRIAQSVERLGEMARSFPAPAGVHLPARSFREADEVASALADSACKLAESGDALRRSEQRLQTILQTASSAIIVTDEAHQVVVFNAAAEAIFGHCAQDMLGRCASELFAPRTWARLTQTCRAGREGATENKPIPCVGTRAGGAHFPAEMLFSSFIDSDDSSYCTLIVRDVTQRVRDQRDLRAARDELRRVNENFQRTLLKEMDSQLAAIARELHDAVASSLAGVALVAAGAKVATVDRPRVVDMLEKIQQQVQQAAQKVRQVSRGLMPAGEEAGALVPALERLATEMSATGGIDVSFLSRGMFGDVPATTSGHVYRIAQEAIANALRHGGATRVRVTLAGTGGAYRLVVADDGMGCDLARQAGSASGIGLRSIRARAAAIDGKAVLRGAPGRGCRVGVCWPAATRP
ncbi:sensor histidine kinase [Ramlibacter albus]|uniref:PAS domain S-box protein n=1 Tax=Ramlibacter albus TaxID=2079448 RepID=A0A923S1Q7_9BURK|nr:PAS domain S-box protein [Ramlibacter albus]MBC5763943.1 PAS domain S-box protein [Ramlibacter albus]